MLSHITDLQDQKAFLTVLSNLVFDYLVSVMYLIFAPPSAVYDILNRYGFLIF